MPLILRRFSLLISIFSGFSFAFASSYYMPYLSMQQNPLNPGYAIHSSALSGFVYNPALHINEKYGVMASYMAYYADLHGISLNGQFVNSAKGVFGFSLSVLFSEAVPIYEVDNYFDPIFKYDEKPFSGFLLGQFSPPITLLGCDFGASGKLVFEYFAKQYQIGTLASIGLVKKTRLGLDIGLALSDFGLPFFFPKNGYFPVSLNASLRQNLAFTQKNRMDIYLGTKYIVPGIIRVLAGAEFSRTFSFLGFSCKADFQKSLIVTDSLYDGFTVGGALFSPKIGDVEVNYLLRLSASGFTHSFGLVYGHVGRP